MICTVGAGVDGGWTKSHSFVEPAMVQSLLVAKSFKGATIEANQIRKFVFLTSINRVQCDSFRVKNSFLSGVSCPFCPSCLFSLSCLFCLFCLSFFFLWVKSRLGWSLVFKNRRGLRLNEVILRWPTTCVCKKMKHYQSITQSVTEVGKELLISVLWDSVTTESGTIQQTASKQSLSALSAIILCFLPTILSLQCIYLTSSGPGDVNLKLDELSLIMPGGEPFALYFVDIFCFHFWNQHHVANHLSERWDWALMSA